MRRINGRRERAEKGKKEKERKKYPKKNFKKKIKKKKKIINKPLPFEEDEGEESNPPYLPSPNPSTPHQ